MDRADLLAHLRATHFESGDRERARSDARRIARFLVGEGARRVVGIGSAFDARRSFTHRSDIDLVVEGIDAGEFSAERVNQRNGYRELFGRCTRSSLPVRVSRRARQSSPVSNRQYMRR